MAWTFNDRTPVYLQIAERIRNEIIGGAYEPDSQIPTVRQLALTAAVNPNTVQKALQELEDEGIIYSRATAGRFVTADPEKLQGARDAAAKKLVKDFLSSAAHLSLSAEDCIKMIEEETK
ncbi:MAG: GntR family transcriptional regulator [Clostridia bacterium]|nr:GntR family transcriptional regulator [Clostridia bacterium]MBR3593374.1 GntR family transcriptional regulator [Clostridia bacterium]